MIASSFRPHQPGHITASIAHCDLAIIDEPVRSVAWNYGLIQTDES